MRCREIPCATAPQYIFKSGELVESAVVPNLEITAADGENCHVAYHNLDAAIFDRLAQADDSKEAIPASPPNTPS